MLYINFTIFTPEEWKKLDTAMRLTAVANRKAQHEETKAKYSWMKDHTFHEEAKEVKFFTNNHGYKVIVYMWDTKYNHRSSGYWHEVFTVDQLRQLL